MTDQEPPLLPEPLRRVKTMLSAQELDLLYRLAKDQYLGVGEIIDGGAFLGGSTLALASGLQANPNVAHRDGRVHSYDLFLSDRFVAEFIEGYPVDSSTRPYYEGVIADVRSCVTVHEGDIATFPWPAERPIEILFIDVAKSWETNDFILHTFFPRLIPGVSTVIQQDYHWPQTPWIGVAMELLADHMTYLGSMPWATAYYRWERALEPGELPERLREIGWDRILDLAARAQRFTPGTKAWAAQECNRVCLLLEAGRPDEAAAMFDGIVASAAAPWLVNFNFAPTFPARV